MDIPFKIYKGLKYFGKNYILNTIQNLIPFYPQYHGCNTTQQIIVYQTLLKVGLKTKIIMLIVMFL